MSTIELDMAMVGAFADRVAGIVAGGATTAMMVVGDRLGLYAALARSGPLTSNALAVETGTSERYVREWLAQQASVGFLTYDAEHESFAMPPEHAAVLAGDDGPASMISAAPLITGLHRRVDDVERAFRSGEGIPWGSQDPTVFEHTERFFRINYRNSLVPEWIPALDGVEELLRRGAYVADIGCGRGAPLLLLAEAFPNSRFVGFDPHEPSITVARERAREAGVADRVHFEVGHGHGYPQDGYDVITFFDAFHDLGDPQGAAAYARGALGGHGSLVLVEPSAGDDLETTLRTEPLAPIAFTASTFLCTPNSISQPGGAALGSQAGPARLRELVSAAGFTSVRVAARSPFNVVLQATP